MHCYHVNDANGDLVDLIPFCSDACHRDYCISQGLEYQGWNGCQEGGNSPEFCANCGVFAGGTPECECQSNNIVVNRLICEGGELCEHRNWIQVPADYLRRR